MGHLFFCIITLFYTDFATIVCTLVKGESVILSIVVKDENHLTCALAHLALWQGV